MCTGRTRGLGVHLLSTGSASTGKDQGNGIPGEKGLVIAGHLNQDQGGLPRGLHLENPAGDHARKVRQGCAHGPVPAPVLTLEHGIHQGQPHHLLLWKELQDIAGDDLCHYI